MGFRFFEETRFKETEVGLIPEDWEVVRLGDVVDVYDKKRIPLSENIRNTKKGIYPYCGANGIIDYIDEYIFDGEYILLAEDGGFFRKFENTAYIMNGKFWVNNHAHIIKAIENKGNNKFICFWLVFEDIQQYVSGTTRQKLTQGAMRKISIPLPPLSEQKAIAEVLQAIQEAKEKTEAVIKATRELKKSMMKQLFTYGVHRVNELRVDRVRELGVNGVSRVNRVDRVGGVEGVGELKETEIGLIPKHWQVVRLGEFVEKGFIKIQFGFPCGKWNDEKKGIVHLRPFNISDDGNIVLDNIKYIENKKNIENYLLKEGDVIFNNTNSEALVGKTGYWNIKKGNFVISNHMTIIRVINKEVFDSFFLAKYLHKRWQEGFYKTICRRHVNQSSISLSRLINIKIPLPPLSEQKAIAEILQAIDDKIQKEESKKQAIEKLFKTMLSNLMSGKLRVNRVESE